ncbi:MAG: DUF4880 domain-containing protein, partial [Rhodospirillaceae bacterium]|nr:DUF4880 domain-containing protein [Rhodospirillaceae bacterium]
MTDIVEFPDRRRVEHEAADWLIKLDRNSEPSADELGNLREWLSRSPVHREELGSLARLWGNMNVLTELAVPLGHAGARARATRPADRGRIGMRVALAGFTAMLILGVAVLVSTLN